ncbi:P-loop containing nucleoside triphosphate hydrolase protein [Imleria badia]|nr:P-loop containing nucleoside triphosphate hydrolase protein [Imleria badia]
MYAEASLWRAHSVLSSSTSTVDRAVKSIMLKARFKPDPADFVIVVMGITGCGKTNFINKLTGNEQRKAGSLKPDTQDVIPHPILYRGLRVVLVDTPGFDNADRPDIEILRVIADWLTQKYPRGGMLKVDGIIYFHKITDNHLSGPAHKIFQMFGRLCGDVALPRTLLVTTMWDQVRDQAVATQRETELRSDFWCRLIEAGSRVDRFYNTPDSAWCIIGRLLDLGKDGGELLLQAELVEQRKRLNETEAGKVLYKRLQTILAEQRKTLNELAEEPRPQNDPALAKSLQEEYDKVDAHLQSTFEEIEEMMIPLFRRILLWLFGPKPRTKAIELDYAHPPNPSTSTVDNSAKSIMSRKRFRSNSKDFVIVIMGSTGCGKTNFINKLTGNAEQLSACDLQPDTQDVIPYPIMYCSHRVVLVDTPGFDDTNRLDIEISRAIADWLGQNYPLADGITRKIAVIYLHRITDNRMSSSAVQSLQMFGLLCADIPPRRTLLVTTMRDQVDPAVAAQRETELTSEFWQKLIKGGTTARKFNNTPASAWEIVDDILRMGNDVCPPKRGRLQEEYDRLDAQLQDVRGHEGDEDPAYSSSVAVSTKIPCNVVELDYT